MNINATGSSGMKTLIKEKASIKTIPVFDITLCFGQTGFSYRDDSNCDLEVGKQEKINL